jgi:hypothetical protein
MPPAHGAIGRKWHVWQKNSTGLGSRQGSLPSPFYESDGVDCRSAACEIL